MNTQKRITHGQIIGKPRFLHKHQKPNKLHVAWSHSWKLKWPVCDSIHLGFNSYQTGDQSIFRNFIGDLPWQFNWGHMSNFGVILLDFFGTVLVGGLKTFYWSQISKLIYITIYVGRYWAPTHPCKKVLHTADLPHAANSTNFYEW